LRRSPAPAIPRNFALPTVSRFGLKVKAQHWKLRLAWRQHGGARCAVGGAMKFMGKSRERFSLGLAGRPLANAITAMILRYETTAWPADRRRGRRPHGPDGLIFDLLSHRGPRLAQDALRKTVGKKRPRKSPVGELLSVDSREESYCERDGRDESVFEGSKSGSASDC
jgi:hypothetical protein